VEGAGKTKPFMSAPPVITLYSTQDSPRLRFVLDWLLKEQLDLEYEVTFDLSYALTKDKVIFYGPVTDGLNIQASTLLWEKDIKAHDYQSGSWNELYVLYYNKASQNRVPFDLFAGLFFLLSRYEEYGTYTPDRHGRYPFTASVLAINQVLERPVIDEWVHWFRQLLISTWHIELPGLSFSFQPSYDIDIAWSYKNKGFGRWAGAAAKALVTGDVQSLISRIKVATGSAPDPYDAFGWMQSLHRQYHLAPLYFILSADRVTSFDKNISPGHPEMQKLVRSLHADGTTGIHPSYFTHNDSSKFLGEKQALETTLKSPVSHSRQHYIRLFFPATYRMLLSGGILNDYSMGYSTTLGFRAGTSHSFYWYDLEREEMTRLRIHPFCFMDTTAHYDLGLSVVAAFERLDSMKQRLEKCGGSLHTIFHNFSLGTDKEWAGWPEAYRTFIESAAR